MITIITRPVIKPCPHRDETDAGTLTITFSGKAPELHHLDHQIDLLQAEPGTHEDFTHRAAVLVPGADVVTTWTTGAWAVEVRDRVEADAPR